MNHCEAILKAFFDRRHFVKYHDLRNSLFASDPIKIIHDAKTISVVIECIRLNQTFGFSLASLDQTVEGLFRAPNSIRLSELVDLSNLNCFRKCVDDIFREYGTPLSERKDLIAEQKIN